MYCVHFGEKRLEEPTPTRQMLHLIVGFSEVDTSIALNLCLFFGVLHSETGRFCNCVKAIGRSSQERQLPRNSRKN